MTNEKNRENNLEKSAKNEYKKESNFLEGFKKMFYGFLMFSDNQKNLPYSSKNNSVPYASSFYRTFI